MWWMMTVVALAAEPVPIPEAETGTLVVVVAWQNESSWAREVWERTVRRLERRWRRADRKSDTSLPPPELPPLNPPAQGSTITLRGDALRGGALGGQVDPTGTRSVQVPPGTYELVVEHERAVPQHIHGVTVHAGETRKIDVALEEFMDENMVTQWGAPRGAQACSRC